MKYILYSFLHNIIMTHINIVNIILFDIGLFVLKIKFTFKIINFDFIKLNNFMLNG